MTFSITKDYNFFKKAQWWTKKELEDYQLSKLKKLGKHWGLKIDSWKDFKKLPLTSKDDLRQYCELGKPKLPHTIRETSGSTGEPLTFYLPKDNGARKEAIFKRHWDWCGLKKGWVARFLSGKPKHPNIDWLRRVIPFNFRKITSKDIDFLINHKPTLIHCTVFTARELIEELEKRGKPKAFKDTILWWSAQDTKNHKPIALKYFKDVFEGYGLAELTPISTECEHHQMHTIMETGVIEVINGEVVVTDFNNFVTPIIRYRTGDLAKLVNKKCKCGRVHPILKNLKGRRVDYYNGPEVKNPINWYLCSPLSHKYNHIVKAWRMEIEPKFGWIRLFVEFKKGYSAKNIVDYMVWLSNQTGLNIDLIEQKQKTRWKHKLLVVK